MPIRTVDMICQHRRLAECVDRAVADISHQKPPTLDIAWRAFLRALSDEITGAHRLHVIDHARHVEAVGDELAARMGLGIHRRSVLRQTALLHDVGKLIVPDTLLVSPTKLAPMHRWMLNRHAMVGARIAAGLGAGDELVMHIHNHHDPCRFTPGEAAYALSSILRVADAIGAMQTNRGYCPARHDSVICEELWRHTPGQFDRRTVAAAVDMLSDASRLSRAA